MDVGERGRGERPPHPRKKANIFSIATITWVLDLFREGYKRDLEVEDLSEPLAEHSSGVLGDIIQREWEGECVRAPSQPSLLRVLMKMFGLKMLAYSFAIAVVEIGIRATQPLFLGWLIDYFTQSTDRPVTSQQALAYATGIVLCSASMATQQPMMLGFVHVGMKMRVACCSLVYRKALKLSRTSLGQTTVGQIVNLLSNDVNRFDINHFLSFLWVSPLLTLVVLYYLWTYVGVSSVFGVCILLGFIPLQVWFGKKTTGLRMRTAHRTDERVRLMNEIISGIQVIKMYTWERPFAYLVSQARRKELKEIQGLLQIKGVIISCVLFHSKVATFFTILAYAMFGNEIDAQKVFVVTCYFSMLRMNMVAFFPQAITQLAEILVSVKRIREFLMLEEIDNLSIQSQKTCITNRKINNKYVAYGDETTPFLSAEHSKELCCEMSGIRVCDATVRWPDQVEDSLSHISLEVAPGQLVAVVGPVGSGKSTLLLALLGELPLLAGSVVVPPHVAYASQEPWLFAGSVRQNIVFGSEYRRDRYRQVVRACALKPDFELLPHGDRTIVGERGVSLSGGQRARINLARAVYKEADVYLLDDPLSAVDTRVGKVLFQECITGYLKGKTVILVTHQLQYLTEVNHIVLMSFGRIESEGTYQDIQSKGTNFMKALRQAEMEEEQDPRDDIITSLPSHHGSVQSVRSTASSVEGVAQQSIQVETMSSGSVGAEVVKEYMISGGGWFSLAWLGFLFLLAQALVTLCDCWIAYWVNLEEIGGIVHHKSTNPYVTLHNLTSTLPPSNATLLTNSSVSSVMSLLLPTDKATLVPAVKSNSKQTFLGVDMTRDNCIYIFSAITFATVVVCLLRSYRFILTTIRASHNLHDTMFNSITRATMYFFNTNPSGRILNRFSKDMGLIDEVMPGLLIEWLGIGLNVLAIVAVVCYVNYWLILPTLLVSIVFCLLRIFYISTARSVKRLEAITRSPMFSHLNASLQGLTTIRAFNAQQALVNEFDSHQDLHSAAWYIFIAASRGFGCWLDVGIFIYISLVTYIILYLNLDNPSTSGGNFGLVITQIISLGGIFQYFMKQSAELENQMTSVERVLEYTHLKPEPPLESPPEKRPSVKWPEKGGITFSQVSLSYGPTEPCVLKNLNFKIAPKEKVGIVGRTGAGKSSLISALFRLADLEGQIIVDGVDTATIGLHDLRSKISIIPQEPVLFSGSVRYNLDPFHQYTDGQLWSALEEVELKAVVGELEGGLGGRVAEAGANLSVGQRQLVCLARAILRQNRILVMDEATANVDPQTDELIQRTIRRKFADCTVLTIAHRLHTIMNCDKVLVMAAGSGIEFDHPHKLLQDTDGVFYNLVEQTGPNTQQLLHNTAAESYKMHCSNGEGHKS